MTIFGDLGRPWVLAWGIDVQSGLADTLRRLAPVVKFLENFEPSSEVRQADYDAIVVIDDVGDLDDHLNILQFGGNPSRDDFKIGDEETFAISRIGTARGLAAQLEVPSGLPVEVDKLSRESLAPWLLTTSPRVTLAVRDTSWRGNPSSIARPKTIQAFVVERGGAPCAGRWRRASEDPDTRSEHWWLPRDCPDPESWVKAAFIEWHSLDPQRFPAGPDWVSDALWMTKAELDAALELQSAKEKLLHVASELEEEVNRCQASFEEKQVAANQAERRLLTSQGEELKEEVGAALTELGFEVIDSDEARLAEGGSLLEDLEIRDETGWTAIVEVRGYNRGAKTSDLQRIARAARGFEKRTGHEPHARWYIVNYNLTQPPPQRRPVLAGAESDVSEFALDNGCVIDTRDLFRLRESVRRSALTAEQGRQALKTCSGVFIHNSDAPE